MSPSQYTRSGSNAVPIAVNDVVLITTPEGTTHASGCGCGSCSGGGAVTGAQGTQGVTGAQGVQGPAGLQGISGAAVDNTDDITEGTTNKYFTIGRVSYEHTQGVTSNSWVISHNLGFKPNVTVVDSAGNIVEGEIAYTNSNSLTVSFSSAFSGKAYIS
jgi:hypothetical protein